MGLQLEPGWLSIELEQSSCILQWVAEAQLVQGLRGWESSLIWLITFHQFLRVVCSFFLWSSKREFHWVRGYFPWHVNECHLSRVYAFMGVSHLIEKKPLSCGVSYKFVANRSDLGWVTLSWLHQLSVELSWNLILRGFDQSLTSRLSDWMFISTRAGIIVFY